MLRHACKFESSRYGVSSTIQISSKFKFNPNPYLQPRCRWWSGSPSARPRRARAARPPTAARRPHVSTMLGSLHLPSEECCKMSFELQACSNRRLVFPSRYFSRYRENPRYLQTPRTIVRAVLWVTFYLARWFAYWPLHPEICLHSSLTRFFSGKLT